MASSFYKIQQRNKPSLSSLFRKAKDYLLRKEKDVGNDKGNYFVLEAYN